MYNFQNDVSFPAYFCIIFLQIVEMEGFELKISCIRGDNSTDGAANFTQSLYEGQQSQVVSVHASEPSCPGFDYPSFPKSFERKF